MKNFDPDPFVAGVAFVALMVVLAIVLGENWGFIAHP